jgi:hypothetical protein
VLTWQQAIKLKQKQKAKKTKQIQTINSTDRHHRMNWRENLIANTAYVHPISALVQKNLIEPHEAKGEKFGELNVYIY